MGEVVHVKFGMEKGWLELKEALREMMEIRLAKAIPERADRALLIAEQIVACMKEFDSCCEFSISADYDIPPGVSREAAATLVNQVMRHVQTQATEAVKKISSEAHKAIGASGTTVITILCADIRD